MDADYSTGGSARKRVHGPGSLGAGRAPSARRWEFDFTPLATHAAPVKRLLILVICLALAGQMAWRAELSQRQKSPVWDAFLHLDYGLNFLRLGAQIPPRDHPYPAAALLALPLALSTPAAAQVEARPMLEHGLHAELRRVEDPRNLFPARRANIAIAALGLLLLGWGVGKSLGGAVGVGVVAIGSLDPGWIAQARFVTTDIIQGLAFGLASVALMRHRATGSRAALLGVAASAALALSAKLSGALIIPGIFFAHLVPAPGEQPAPRLRARILAGLRTATVAGLVAFALWLLVFELPALAGRAPLSAVFAHLRAGLESFVEVRGKTRGTFLLGAFYPSGSYLYFPVLLATKTPIVILGLGATALLHPTGRATLSRGRIFFVLPALYLAVAVASKITLGYRHLTPVLPALWIAGAAGAAALLERSGKAWLSVTLAASLLAAEVLPAHPDYLPWTHALAGGVEGARRIAVDSATDWGQDLPALAGWIRSHGDLKEPIHLAYFGTARPERLGIRSVWRPCGALGRPKPKGPKAPCGAAAKVLAVSATCLQGVANYGVRDSCWARLRGRAPEVVLGGSILIFRDVPAQSRPATRKSSP